MTKRTALCSSVRVPEEMPGSLRTPERSSRRSLFGARLHSVPCSTRLQGRKGHKEISSSNSPRAPATAGFEQCTPLIKTTRELGNRPSPRLRPGEAGDNRGFKVGTKGLGANEFFEGLSLWF